MSRRIRPGLCSVTFRALEPEAVLDLAVAAGLEAIEWGADVHLPPGDAARANALAGRCKDAGVACPSYGTYFFAGASEPDTLAPMLDTAAALGAEHLRIWAEMGVQPGAAAADVERIAAALRLAADAAQTAGLRLALEFHPGTLTETAASALDLLTRVGHDALSTYWQPDPRDAESHSLAELSAVLPRLAHVHVFAWQGTPPVRLPLGDREGMWREALAAVAASDGVAPECVAYLEFVRDDSPDAFRTDAAALVRWVGESPP